MTQVSSSGLRRELARYLNEATETGAPIIVTRRGRPNVVIVSAAELAGWKETVHLLSSPANAQRLLRSIAEADAGRVGERDLVKTDE